MKKHRLKQIVALGVSVVLLATGAVACGNSNSGSTGDTNASETESESSSTTSTTSTTSSSSDGDVYTLTVQSQDPQTSATGQFLDAWAEAIEEASDGRLQLDIFHGGSLGSGTESYNMVVSGSVDIAWGLPSYTTGKFPLTDVISLPFMTEDTLQASYALWDLYDTTDYLDDEWSEVKVLLLHTNCDSPLLLKDSPMETPEDLRGRTIRFMGGVSTTFATDLGINPTTMAAADAYTSLEKGVVDGVANFGWDAVESFKLYEQVDYIYDWKMSVNPYFLVMNWDSYNALPEDLQEIIDEYSGFKALEYVGTKWQDIRKSVTEEQADKIYPISDETMDEFKEVGDEVTQEWIDEMDESGVDAQGLYDACVERVEKYTDKIAE